MSNEVDELVANRLMGDQQSIDRFLAALSALPATPDAALVSSLSDAFDDETDHPEVMFNLIHLIERAPRALEVDFLLAHLIDLPPGWAEMILFRVLNGPETRSLLLSGLFALTPEQAERLARMLEQIASEPGPPSEPAREVLARLRATRPSD